MKFSTPFKLRVTSSLWLIIIAVFSFVWWIVIIIEYFEKKKQVAYVVILKDAYKTIWGEIKETIIEIKTGNISPCR